MEKIAAALERFLSHRRIAVTGVSRQGDQEAAGLHHFVQEVYHYGRETRTSPGTSRSE